MSSKTAAMFAASLFIASVHAGDAAPQTTLLLFTAPEWCAPCQQLEANILGSEEWVSLPHKKKVVIVDDHRLLARKHRVRSVPTAVLLDAKGTEVARKSGYKGESPAEWLKPFR